MRAWSLDEVAEAVRSAWTRATCDPADLETWTPENPARGQCGATALVVHDLLGGDLMLAEVHWPDGTHQGFHYWNALPAGEVDLTREQFQDGEIVGAGRLIVRPPGPPNRCAEQYLLLRQRTLTVLLAGRGNPSPP